MSAVSGETRPEASRRAPDAPWRRGVGIRNPSGLVSVNLTYPADRALLAGAALVVWDPAADPDLSDARILRGMAAGFSVPFVVLDDVAVARAVGADAILTAVPPVSGAAHDGSAIAGAHFDLVSVAAAHGIDLVALVALDTGVITGTSGWRQCRDAVRRVRSQFRGGLLVSGEFSVDEVRELGTLGVDWVVVGRGILEAARAGPALRQLAAAGPAGTVALHAQAR